MHWEIYKSISYREASAAFEYASVYGISGIQFYYDIKYSNNNTNIIESLSKHIDEREENKLLEMLINIEKQLEGKHISIQNARFLLVDLIALFIYKCGDYDVKNSIFEYPNIFLIPEYNSAENFMDMLKRIESDYRMLFSESCQKHYANLTNSMKNYVNLHYDSPEFSLNQMANEFNMTISSLSKFFRDITGTNINDYITELKMKKANHTENYLFCGPKGQLWLYEYYSQKYERLLKKHGLKYSDYNPYRFRHSYCTYLFRRNINMKAIQMIMGDNTPTMIMKVYANLDKTDVLSGSACLSNDIDNILRIPCKGTKI